MNASLIEMIHPTEFRLTRKGTHWPVTVRGKLLGRWHVMVSMGTVAEAEEWVRAYGGVIVARNVRGEDA